METLHSLKSTILLIIAIGSFYSCDFQNNEPEGVTYNLLLNYTDVSGNDLVRNLVELDTPTSHLYKLEIVLPEPCDDWRNESYNIKGGDTASPHVFYHLFNNRYYFTGYFNIPVGGCPATDILTHRVKCPELFGDEAVREIVSYWDVPKKQSTGHQHEAKCYRIEFEGNEITPTPMDKTSSVFIATLIVKR